MRSVKSSLSRLRETRGLLRSLAIYRGNPLRHWARRRLYSDFIGPGDLCFDIGAHAGNHVACWLDLGARVVAIEPQPRFMQLLRRFYEKNQAVTLVEAAVGATPGQASLHISRATPTVTTLSSEWIALVGHTASFRKVTWDSTLEVPVTTLDALIARHGCPAFCKIDVEGLEAAALAGLSQPIPMLSFEYVPAAPDAARACLDRLAELGDYRFNLSVGESQSFRFDDWVEAENLRAWLAALHQNDRSGDVYCRLKTGARP